MTKEFDARGELVRGGREINPEEADIVRQIFKSFADGRSPEAIAKELNHRGVSGPQSGTWGPSTIYGNWRRGTGILNNELYMGRMVWNRLRYIKDPMTGKRVSKLNEPKEWIVKAIPELSIVDHGLWERVKLRQKDARRRVTAESQSGIRPERARRPVYLFSGLIRCGACGGGFTMVNKIHYACNNARNKGTCDNMISIRRDRLEDTVLDGLKSKLMDPGLVREFVAEYHRELNRLSGQVDIEKQRHEKELKRVEQDIRAIIDGIKAGFRSDAMRDELEKLEAQKRDIKTELSENKPSPVRLHPNLADIYHAKIEKLREALNREDSRPEAANILRSLIEEIRLVPKEGKLNVHLVGHLAQLLDLGQNKQPGLKETGLQVTLVAGIGFEPMTFRL